MSETSLVRLRDDAHRLAVGCLRLERQLKHNGIPSDSSGTRVWMAARDVRHACQDLVEILGDDIPKSEPLAATQDRILVVDDVADVAEMVAAVLENAGFEVVTATNGLEGLLAAHRSRPTVILMDLQMPVLDGIETTRLLKAAATTRHIPVIAHTARPDSCHVPPEQLFAHVLPKPVIPEVLLALVQRFVRN